MRQITSLSNKCVISKRKLRQQGKILREFGGNYTKRSKVRLKLPVCISVSPVHTLDDGACHERSLVEAGETIRQCIDWPSHSLLVGSGPMRRPQGFPSDC